jgi:cytochrome c biogenesis protein CcmG, thiol:disulfide interchange protein DsbE
MIGVFALGVAVVTIAALAGHFLAGSQAKASPPLARPFSLAELGSPGRTISLSAYAGRPLLINFFASTCPPCQRETPLLASFYRDEHGKALVIGIDANLQAGPEQRWLHAKGVTYPVGLDVRAGVLDSYGITAIPQTLFLNARHQIVRHVFGALTGAELRWWAATLADRARTR